MHLRYVHLLPADQEAEVRRVFEEERFRGVHLAAADAPGQLVVDGVTHTPTTDGLLRYTLARRLARRTHGLWGGFWVGALAEHGTVPPQQGMGEVVVTTDTFHHAVTQYRYQALALAVSEVALERGLPGRYTVEVPAFLKRRGIEDLVAQHLAQIQEHLRSPLYVRLMERDIAGQRAFLRQLADILRPFWERLGLASVEELVLRLLPEGLDAFQAP